VGERSSLSGGFLKTSTPPGIGKFWILIPEPWSDLFCMKNSRITLIKANWPKPPALEFVDFFPGRNAFIGLVNAHKSPEKTG
jgi:hypothetical protein